MKKAKNKNLRRAVGFLALAALTAGLAAMRPSEAEVAEATLADEDNMSDAMIQIKQ